MKPSAAAEALKAEGNVAFGKEKYNAAVEKYTEAIVLENKWTTAYVNRALCHRKMGNWENVEADCRTALRLDDTNVKAKYMLGLALLEKAEPLAATSMLQKALESARESGSNIQDEIWRALAKAKYEQWRGPAKKRKVEHDAMHALLERLLKQHHAAERDLIPSASGGGEAGGEAEPMSVGEGGAAASTSEGPEGEADGGVEGEGGEGLAKRQKAELELLSTWAQKARAEDVPSEIPDWATCKLSMDVFRDPWITPSGMTYEKAVLLEHLAKVGRWDPVTRAPCTADKLVSNNAIRAATQAYLDAHPWGYADVLGIDPSL